jgi:hypothetical protein
VANKRVGKHAILDDGVFVIVMLQLLNIARCLMDKMIIMLLDMQLPIVIPW